MADVGPTQRQQSFDDRVYDELKPEGRAACWLRYLVTVGRWLKAVITSLLSQFGLLALVVVYAIIGALIFGQLERPNEKGTCTLNRQLYNLSATHLLDRMWEVVKAYQQPTDFNEATYALTRLLDEHKDTVRIHQTKPAINVL